MRSIRHLPDEEDGAALVTLAVAVLLAATAAASLGLWILMTLRGENAHLIRLQALALAESGIARAITVVEGAAPIPSEPVRVCRSSTSEGGNTCSQSSPDYVGCFTFSSSPFDAKSLADCPSPSAPTATGGTYRLYGLGITSQGARAQVMVLYDADSGGTITWDIVLGHRVRRGPRSWRRWSVLR